MRKVALKIANGRGKSSAAQGSGSESGRIKETLFAAFSFLSRPRNPNPIPDLACWSSGSNSQLWKIEFLQKHLKLNIIKFEIAILDSAEHVQLETTRDLAGSVLGQREDTLDAVCDSKCYNLTQVFAKQNSKKDYLI